MFPFFFLKTSMVTNLQFFSHKILLYIMNWWIDVASYPQWSHLYSLFHMLLELLATAKCSFAISKYFGFWLFIYITLKRRFVLLCSYDDVYWCYDVDVKHFPQRSQLSSCLDTCVSQVVRRSEILYRISHRTCLYLVVIYVFKLVWVLAVSNYIRKRKNQPNFWNKTII